MSNKKNWKVTLSYIINYSDTYLIKNVSKEDAKWIAENQNRNPQYDCTLILKDESDIEEEVLTIKEVK